MRIALATASFNQNLEAWIAILIVFLLFKFAFIFFFAHFCTVREKELRGVSIQVDKLTHSIEDARTGQRLETAVERLLPEHLHEIKKSRWLFDWKAEILVPGREVYKLVCIEEPKVIQGLVSIENRHDHVYLHLIENAKFNRMHHKRNLGVAGNLFAFACKTSFENGHEGFVVFESKSKLVNHYMDSIGGKRLFGNRLFLDLKVAKQLISRYFRCLK